MTKVIMGIELASRADDAVQLQELLTKYGCYIKTRVGVHDTDAKGTKCSPKGIIILEFVYGAEEQITKFEEELSKLDTVTVKKMEF